MKLDIADRSYFEPYQEKRDGGIARIKVCPYCLEKVELDLDTGKGVACNLPHKCSFWADELRRKNETCSKQLIENGFIYI